MTRKILERFLGLDFGNSKSKVCYTVRNEAGLDVPKPVTFGDKNNLPTFVKVNQSQISAIKVGDEAYKEAAFENDCFQEDIKLRLVQGELSAANCMQAISLKFVDELKELFNMTEVSGEAFPSMAGWSFGIERGEKVTNRLKAGIEPSGFIISGWQDEALAALEFASHQGLVKFYRGKNCRVLILDLAGVNSRFSLYEHAESGLSFKDGGMIDWGGDQIDRQMLDSWFIPQYCAGVQPFPPILGQLLKFRMRDFKENFSENVNRGNPAAKFDFRELGIDRRDKLSRDEFETPAIAGNVIFTLEELLRGIKRDHKLEEINHIILVGGSANWYFIKDMVQQTWTESNVHIFASPELVIAQGLALHAGGYTIETRDMPAETIESEVGTSIPGMEVKENHSFTPPAPDQTSELRKKQKKAAEKLIWPYIIYGTVIAAALAPVPGIAPVILIGMEIWMTIQISKVYNVKLEGTMIIVAGVLLLAMSIGLKTAVEFVLTVFYVLCFLKPLVAGIVVWGLGQAAIVFFDRIAYEGGFESIW